MLTLLLFKKCFRYFRENSIIPNDRGGTSMSVLIRPLITEKLSRLQEQEGKVYF